MNNKMKIVVIGGTGLIGSKVVNILRQRGHEVVAASPSSGVNTLTGEGLAEALTALRSSLMSRTRLRGKTRLLWSSSKLRPQSPCCGKGRRSEASCGPFGSRHRPPYWKWSRSLSGYFSAKMAQENLIKASGIPFTIVHATQFFEFVKSIAQNATDGSTIRLSSALMQPIASDDVAAAVADVALGEPMNGMVEIAGPEQIRQDELVRQFLTATGDPRNVVTDVNAGYYGIEVNDQSLVPGNNPRLGTTHFEEWLSRTTPQKNAIERQSAPASNLPGK